MKKSWVKNIWIKIKPLFRNPYFITISCGLIVTIISDIKFEFNIFSWLWKQIKLAICFIIKFDLTLKLWLLLLIGFLIWFIPFGYRKYYAHRKTKKKPERPGYVRNYTEDFFEPIFYKWKWAYDPYHHQTWVPVEITSYCKLCNCKIAAYSCPVCKTSYYNDIRDDDTVRALIQHKIENKLWKESV